MSDYQPLSALGRSRVIQGRNRSEIVVQIEIFL